MAFCDSLSLPFQTPATQANSCVAEQFDADCTPLVQPVNIGPQTIEIITS